MEDFVDHGWFVQEQRQGDRIVSILFLVEDKVRNPAITVTKGEDSVATLTGVILPKDRPTVARFFRDYVAEHGDVTVEDPRTFCLLMSSQDFTGLVFLLDTSLGELSASLQVIYSYLKAVPDEKSCLIIRSDSLVKAAV